MVTKQSFKNNLIQESLILAKNHMVTKRSECRLRLGLVLF